jgi:hypothetical protein
MIQLPIPSFTKMGILPPFGKREVRRDFIADSLIILRPLSCDFSNQATGCCPIVIIAESVMWKRNSSEGVIKKALPGPMATPSTSE